MTPSEIYNLCLAEHRVIYLQITPYAIPLKGQQICIDPTALTQQHAIHIIEKFGNHCEWKQVQPNLGFDPIFCPSDIAENLYRNLEHMFTNYDKYGPLICRMRVI